MRRRLDDESAVTLVELMVAILILGIVMGAMASSLTTALFGVQGQERQVRATALMQEILEQVAGLPWDDTGLCETDALSHFGGTSYTYPDGTTESLVLLADTSDYCTAPLVDPVQILDRDGVSYTVETVVTWSDDDLDGAGPTDPDTLDLKHVLVNVTWDHRGEARDLTSETYLAEEGRVLPYQTLVDHGASETYTYLTYYTVADDDDEGDDPQTLALTTEPVTLRLTAERPQSAVSVRWPLQHGSLVSPQPMTDVSGDGRVWEKEIPDGAPSYDINEFANGETLFTFVATDADTGDTTTIFDRGLFILHPDLHVISGSDVPTTIHLESNGALCPFDLSVTVDGALTSDLVSAVWTTGPPEQPLTADSATSTSTTFTTTYGSSTAGFAAGTTSLTISTERIADGEVEDITRSVTVVQLAEGDACPA